MTEALVKGAIAMALLGAPAAALASAEVGGGAAGEAGGAIATTRGPGAAPDNRATISLIAPDPSRMGKFAPPSRRKLAATGERLAASQAKTLSGPAFTYRTRGGPLLEIAALGGGAIDGAPFLAHLGLGWKF